jgi:hypothetical protein
MPYIKPLDRERFEDVKFIDPDNAGELNYVFTKIAHNYIKNKGEKYQHYNDLIGALEGAKLELYRRYITPYEDKKIGENGDV